MLSDPTMTGLTVTTLWPDINIHLTHTTVLHTQPALSLHHIMAPILLLLLLTLHLSHHQPLLPDLLPRLPGLGMFSDESVD